LETHFKKSALTLTPVFFFALLMAISLGSGCASRATRSGGVENGSPEAPSSGGVQTQNIQGEVYGPAGPVVPPSPVYGPEPSLVHPLVLVLGPGQARGFAHAGVLRALSENKIPIAAIYGVEMGGLLGALYAQSANINHFEWSLQNFGEDTLSPHASLMDRLLNKNDPAGPLSRKLQQEFGGFDIANAKIPLKIVVFAPEDPARAVVLDKGPATRLIRGSMQNLTNKPMDPATIAATEQMMCDEARARYGSPVVLIETSGSSVDPSSADLVIRPELSDIFPQDYSKNTDVAFRGKTAANSKMPEISRAVNLPLPQNIPNYTSKSP
jgi:hypothetical protein